MLDSSRDDVRMVAVARKENAFQREVVSLAAAARKHNLLGRTTEEIRDLPAALVDQCSCRRACPMRARGVAERVLHDTAHDCCHFGSEWRARVVIEIEASHQFAVRSVADYAAAFVELVFIDLTASIPFLEDIERSASM